MTRGHQPPVGGVKSASWHAVPTTTTAGGSMKYTIVAPGGVEAVTMEDRWTLVKGDPQDPNAWMHISQSNGTREGLVEQIKDLRESMIEQSLNLLHEADALLEALTTTEEEV